MEYDNQSKTDQEVKRDEERTSKRQKTVEYDNQSKTGEEDKIDKEGTSKRQKTDIQSDIKKSIDNLFGSKSDQSKLTGVLVKKKHCYQGTYGFVMNVEVNRKSGHHGCFEYFANTMIRKASPKLHGLIWKTLEEIKEEYAASDLDDDEELDLISVFQ